MMENKPVHIFILDRFELFPEYNTAPRTVAVYQRKEAVGFSIENGFDD
jgi:hypothetical protein